MTLMGTFWPDPFVLAVICVLSAGAAACIVAALWSLVPMRWRHARRPRPARTTHNLLRPAAPVGQTPLPE